MGVEQQSWPEPSLPKINRDRSCRTTSHSEVTTGLSTIQELTGDRGVCARCLSIQEGTEIFRELERILEREKVVALLCLRVNVEGRIGDNGFHPPLTRNVGTVLAREDSGRDIDLSLYNVTPIDACVVVHNPVDGCHVYRDH